MFRSRAAKTLGILVAAMTVGTLALTAMETGPLQPSANHLAAVPGRPTPSVDRVVRGTSPLQRHKWRHIIVHADDDPRCGLVPACHFIVDLRDPAGGAVIRRTRRWDDQADGRHAFLPGLDWNRTSIGICLLGDFTRTAPSPGQLNALVELTRRLQELTDIPRDRVYLAGQIGQEITSPGPAFPTRAYRGALLRGAR
jgi:hypothetical protein